MQRRMGHIERRLEGVEASMNKHIDDWRRRTGDVEARLAKLAETVRDSRTASATESFMAEVLSHVRPVFEGMVADIFPKLQDTMQRVVDPLREQVRDVASRVVALDSAVAEAMCATVAVGDSVELRGLSSSAELNGQRGRVVSVEGAPERIDVQLDAGARPKALKPVNVRRVCEPSTAEQRLAFLAERVDAIASLVEDNELAAAVARDLCPEDESLREALRP